MPRLLLLTPAELTRDARARRTAVAARARGFDVIGLCGRITGEESLPLDGVPITRVGRPGRLHPRRELGVAAATRQPAAARELRGIYRLARLVVRTLQLRSGGRRLQRADVVHANDLDTLPAAWLLARTSGAHLVYDAHELYSAFEPDPPRLYGHVTRLLEAALARRATVVTVSEPIARELERRLRLFRPPLVVLNAPEVDEREPMPTPAGEPLRAVYQGSFGTGRPLEELLEAFRQAPSVRLTIRAVRIDPATLRAAVAARGLEDRVDIAEPVPPDHVGETLRGLDVGVIFDRPVTLNGRLSLPNKLFDYLMAGLAVVAPRLPALTPIVEGERVGSTFEPGPPHHLAAALEALAHDRDVLTEMRQRARRLALERYNAGTQAAALAAAWRRD